MKSMRFLSLRSNTDQCACNHYETITIQSAGIIIIYRYDGKKYVFTLIMLQVIVFQY